MRALSVRQPYAELILRGVKTVEYRSRVTRIVGERFYLYAAGTWPTTSGRRKGPARVWSKDLTGPGDGPPAWMTAMAERLILGDLPTGVIVGSAVIDRVTPYAEGDGLGYEGLFRWHLADVRRAKSLRKPKGHPQPVWFEPF